MKFLRDIDVKNKKVLVRVDFNVSFNESGKISDDFRIKTVLPTINYLKKQNSKIILISHLGRPSLRQNLKYSLKPVALRLEKLLKQKVKFIDDCIGQKVKKEVEKMKPRDILLLENLRFYSGEKENNLKFAKELANLADVFINDAFSACHRKHASVVAITKYIPSVAGFLLEKEIKNLSQVLQSPKKPLVLVIGGIKISSKLPLIKKFLKIADKILMGGALANTVLKAEGIEVGKSIMEKEMLKEVLKLPLKNRKIYLPLNGIVSGNFSKKGKAKTIGMDKIGKREMILDIGPKTIKIFSEIISQAKTIIWNGPMGYFEKREFRKGTEEIAKSILKNKKAKTIIGGGETISSLRQVSGFKFQVSGNIFISTGGGAMLEFLSGKKLPGIKALEK